MDSSKNSTSSSSSSRKGSEERLSDFIIEKKSKKSRKSVNLSESFGLGSVAEVNEEREDIFISSRIPHLKIPNDNYEFKEKLYPKVILKRTDYSKRIASLSPHGSRGGLAKVEEVNGDDDLSKNKCILKLVFDNNEFNDRRGRTITLRGNNDVQYQMQQQHIPIIEDAQENIKEKIQQNTCSVLKLKVDEIDFQENKQLGEEIMEIIEEEKPEIIINQKEKEMFIKVKKILHEERDFLKRILKGELIQQEDLIRKQEYSSLIGETQWNQLIQEAEEFVNSDEDIR